MHVISIEETLFFAFVWGLAFLASLSRAARDVSIQSLRHALSLGCTSGFVALGVVAIWTGREPTSVAGGWYFLGVATLIGLSGPDQDKIARMVLMGAYKNAFVFLRAVIDRKDKDSDG